MRRTLIATALVTLALGMIRFVFWSKISDRFGPMEQRELVCLICHRDRIEKWVCGSKVRDDIGTSEYSEWVDSFTPSDHKHAWYSHTHHGRRDWFGPTSIGCGGCAGITTIPRIFERRGVFGELESQQLALEFHRLVARHSPEDELYRFERTLIEKSNSLLEPDGSN